MFKLRRRSRRVAAESVVTHLPLIEAGSRLSSVKFGDPLSAEGKVGTSTIGALFYRLLPSHDPGPDDVSPPPVFFNIITYLI